VGLLVVLGGCVGGRFWVCCLGLLLMLMFVLGFVAFVGVGLRSSLGW